MYEQRAVTVVPAPVDRVYELFTHFHRYPEFLRQIKSVTYYDDQNSHWIVDAGERSEYDAINEGWQRNARIGWRATQRGRETGEVLFEPTGRSATRVFVRLRFEKAPAQRAQRELQQDLETFARTIGGAAERGEIVDWKGLGSTLGSHASP